MSIYDYVAFILITAGWAVQLTNSDKKSRLNSSFLTLYIVGSLMLAFNALGNHYITVSLLNLSSAAIASAVMIRQR